MKIFKNFKKYPLEVPTFIDYVFRTDDGQDWYGTVLKELDNGLLKIAFESDNIIRTCGYDATGLYPENRSVTSIEEKDIPKGFAANGEWMFDGEKIVPRIIPHEESLAKASALKAYYLDVATDAINPLQDAADLGIATDEEKRLLPLWKKYRIDVNRVNLSKAPEITWPTNPS
ncbi:tail fiber assembly protein [Pantoea ananatis]|uniref:tail fiber assembly protein n=1 Tax=Pantoea ananas TaxID=553 RepID=UPI00091C02BB|nr:tail fiber assembly protein [Pantoea ananatis]SFX17462.1 virus tail fibre assembly protein, lambda gpK [Pantoea ananatis]